MITEREISLPILSIFERFKKILKCKKSQEKIIINNLSWLDYIKQLEKKDLSVRGFSFQLKIILDLLCVRSRNSIHLAPGIYFSD